MGYEGRSYNYGPLVLSLGSINADFQVRVARRPQVSETLEASDFRRFSGGKAANVSYFARFLGLESLLIGHVGDDDLAGQALDPLSRVGVNLDHVAKVAGQSTGVAMISVPPDGKKGIVLASNANRAWKESDLREVLKAIYSAPPGSVLAVDCEIPMFVLESAAAAAKERQFKVIVDPSPADNITDALIAMADFITPNVSEAKTLTGIDCDDSDASACAGDMLVERGAKVAVIKLADGGCLVVREDQCLSILPIPVTVNDTTGAGDAFAGALAVALTEKRPTITALSFAVAASHLAVTDYGSQAALPNREQIESLMTLLDVQHNELHSH